MQRRELLKMTTILGLSASFPRTGLAAGVTDSTADAAAVHVAVRGREEQRVGRGDDGDEQGPPPDAVAPRARGREAAEAALAIQKPFWRAI